jgi:hypothetical protein
MNVFSVRAVPRSFKEEISVNQVSSALEAVKKMDNWESCKEATIQRELDHES